MAELRNQLKNQQELLRKSIPPLLGGRLPAGEDGAPRETTAHGFHQHEVAFR